MLCSRPRVACLAVRALRRLLLLVVCFVLSPPARALFCSGPPVLAPVPCPPAPLLSLLVSVLLRCSSSRNCRLFWTLSRLALRCRFPICPTAGGHACPVLLRLLVLLRRSFRRSLFSAVFSSGLFAAAAVASLLGVLFRLAVLPAFFFGTALSHGSLLVSVASFCPRAPRGTQPSFFSSRPHCGQSGSVSHPPPRLAVPTVFLSPLRFPPAHRHRLSYFCCFLLSATRFRRLTVWLRVSCSACCSLFPALGRVPAVVLHRVLPTGLMSSPAPWSGVLLVVPAAACASCFFRLLSPTRA